MLIVEKVLFEDEDEKFQVEWDGEDFTLWKFPLKYGRVKSITLGIITAGKLAEFIKEMIKHG